MFGTQLPKLSSHSNVWSHLFISQLQFSSLGQRLLLQKTSSVSKQSLTHLPFSFSQIRDSSHIGVIILQVQEELGQCLSTHSTLPSFSSQSMFGTQLPKLSSHSSVWSHFGISQLHSSSSQRFLLQSTKFVSTQFLMHLPTSFLHKLDWAHGWSEIWHWQSSPLQMEWQSTVSVCTQSLTHLPPSSVHGFVSAQQSLWHASFIMRVFLPFPSFSTFHVGVQISNILVFLNSISLLDVSLLNWSFTSWVRSSVSSHLTL